MEDKMSKALEDLLGLPSQPHHATFTQEEVIEPMPSMTIQELHEQTIVAIADVKGLIEEQHQTIAALTEEIHILSDEQGAYMNRLKIIEELHVHETMFRGTEGETIENESSMETS